MAKRKTLRFATMSGVIVLVAGLGVGLAAGVAGANNGKNVVNPDAGLSDAQRAAMQKAAHVRNDLYLKDFVVKHRDPHTLPVVEVPTYAAPPTDLAQARSAAALVVVGKVSDVTFQSSPSGGMPLATATIAVERIVKGQAGSTLVVRQLGGPVAQGSGGALAEFDTDHLLLPGDHVLLMLSRGATDPFYRPLLGVGVNQIRADGTVVAEESNPFRGFISGRTVAEVVATLVGP